MADASPNPKATDLGKIPANAGQAFSFVLTVAGDIADLASFTGMALVGQVRKTAAVAAPLVTPTITLAAPVTTATSVSVAATIAVSQAQMAELPCHETGFLKPTSYVLDIEGAYGDAPTVFAFRYYGSIDVYQGGVVV
jgi:hypothetical protein